MTMADADTDWLIDDDTEQAVSHDGDAWKVLVVDDDDGVHIATRIALSDYQFRDCPLELLSAYSAREGEAILRDQDGIALIMLDVVMETEDAGLLLARKIRDELGNHEVRILLRTGQPGQAPQRSVIRDYDINDYKSKTELSDTRLFTAVTTALRSYDHIVRLRDSRMQIEAAYNHLRAAETSLVDMERLAGLAGMVASVSHELNTPISVAHLGCDLLDERIGALETMLTSGRVKRDDLTGALARLTETATLLRSNLKRSVELIEAFKHLSVDQASGEPRRVDLAIYLDEIVLSLKPRLKRKPHALTVTCPAGIVMFTYPGAFAQVITNLIANSLIHAFEDDKPGHMTLTVTPIDGDAAVKIVYADDGKGVDDADLDRLFEPFYTTKRGRGGSGLGLSVVKKVVIDTLGGKLDVSSVLGAGLTYTITLPLTAPAGSDADEATLTMS